MAASISRTNYSYLVRVVNGAGELLEHEHLTLCPRLTRTRFPDNTEYIVKDDDNWSRVSWKLLGNGRHWWVIAEFSEIIDPFSELHPLKTVRPITQLNAAQLAGTYSTIALKSVRGIKRGMQLRLESLDPATPDNMVDVSVLEVNATDKTVKITPTACPAFTTLNRVSTIQDTRVRLVVPSIKRLLFDVLAFDKPVNTLGELHDCFKT